ncbi:MAG: divalent cation tolerance protein CutA [Methyloprofundus sp.]|nr:divalent cation tolerance protein CutA [Methyloprofundus sp.]
MPLFTLSHQLILSTCPDFITAKRLATQIVEINLAACVNILPNLSSLYRWQAKVDVAQGLPEYLQWITSCTTLK